MIIMMMMMMMMVIVMVKQIANLVINSSKDQDVQYEQRGANGNGDAQGGGIGGQASLNFNNSYFGEIKSRKKICILKRNTEIESRDYNITSARAK